MPSDRTQERDNRLIRDVGQRARTRMRTIHRDANGVIPTMAQIETGAAILSREIVREMRILRASEKRNVDQIIRDAMLDELMAIMSREGNTAA